MSKESSLDASFKDGIFASLMLGFSTNYITPFAMLLGANNFYVGLLNSIPQIFGSAIQLKSTEIVNTIKSRVKAITLTVFLQASTLIMACLIFLLPKELHVGIFIFLIVLNAVFGSMAAPAWLSLISDTADKNKYGEYFAWRGKVFGFIVLISNFVAGFLLFIIPNKIIGFVILFLLAGVCRIISGIFLGKMDDIPVEKSGKADFSYFQFIKRISESNFTKFVLFVSLMNFATYLSAPFFAVYMLNDLKFKYSTYTIIKSASALSALISLPFWGRLADKYGNVKVIKSSALLLPLVPILWIFSKNPVYLIIVDSFGGYAWAGFNLAVVNFIFDSSSCEVRTRCASYFNFTNGTCIFLGAIIGGYLATHMPALIFSSILLTLFFVSGAARFLVNIFMLGKFHEVRNAEAIGDLKIFNMILGIAPVLNLGEEIYNRKNKQN
ncbi:MAG: hypothetical protein A2539_05015 [Elusimicrobia bacterium RIFOXYD2_FULL_34_15]|nr:MAG: hypothetical protein A2539_05015 [Elusimicrobia bacterium RIFOXYD2_FULL_34_15]